MKSRIQLLLAFAVVVALVTVGALIWIDRMQPVAITISALSGQSMRISVSGAVATPGLVEVPTGARLQDVVDEAGGFTEDADLAALNLAGRVGDGEQIVIPAIGAPTATPTSSGTVPDVGLIDINTASAAELDQLPGIGEVLAGRIIEYRETHGAFTSIDQLAEIDGISPRLVEQIRPFVTLSLAG